MALDTRRKVLCKTVEESRAVRERLDDLGLKWSSGHSYSSLSYDWCFEDEFYIEYHPYNGTLRRVPFSESLLEYSGQLVEDIFKNDDNDSHAEDLTFRMLLSAADEE